jgi:hypothetical protein
MRPLECFDPPYWRSSTSSMAVVCGRWVVRLWLPRPHVFLPLSWEQLHSISTG